MRKRSRHHGVAQHGGVSVSWYRPTFEPNGDPGGELAARVIKRLSGLDLLVNDVAIALHGP